MVRALDLQPLLEYIQWYCEIGKLFLFGGSSMVVPLHTTLIGQPLPDPHHVPELEPKTEPELHSGDSSYHPDLGGDDYFPGSSGHRYHSEFDIFNPLPPQYFALSGPYPLPYSTPPSLYPPSYFTPPDPYPSLYSTPPDSCLSMVFET
ncbi:hypothetical protein PVK06_024335 [Gossypium arboreum]|uniref:Uncharacterized protein n=1 Tax=Gossypium arboreum TaxID=29729 RepID=A0ABR0PDK6_GOSAR|nr:hypothetical protein PVK06_024335 [Gossypium arboreum]